MRFGLLIVTVLALSFPNQSSAQVSFGGRAYDDRNGNGTANQGESPLSGWTFFIDANGNGSLDGSELSEISNGSGEYEFRGLAAGNYTVLAVVPSAWVQTEPASGGYTFTIADQASRQDLVFGAYRESSISGTVFQDADGDGIQDAGDPGLPNWTVYIDSDSDGQLDGGEASTTSDSNGDYSFTSLAPGTFVIAIVLPAGFEQSSPGGGAHTINIVSGSTETGADFGNNVLAPAELNPNPNSLVFSLQPAGVTSAVQTVTITNIGDQDAEVSGINIIDDVSGVFSVTTISETLPWTLSGGAEMTADVSFSSSAIGSFTATLEISSSTSGVASAEVTLSGAAGAGVLTAHPDPVSFGSVVVGSSSNPSTVTITNSGNADLVLTGISITGDVEGEFSIGTPIGPMPATITPGGSAFLFDLTFSPTSTGLKTVSIVLSSGSLGVSDKTVSVIGTGVPAPTPGVLVASPQSFQFALQAIGSTAPATLITVSNSGGADVVVSGFTILNDVSGAFSLIAVSGQLPMTLASGVSMTVAVTSTPSSSGPFSAILRASTSTTGVADLDIPLSGEAEPGVLSASPSPLSFGTVAVGTTSSPSALSLWNSGRVDLTYNSATINGDVEGSFSISSSSTSLPAVISPNDPPITVELTFSPSSTGPKTANVVLSSSSPGVAPVTIPISGTADGSALPGVITISPSPVQFGVQALGTTSSPQTVTISNAGGQDVSISSFSIQAVSGGVFSINPFLTTLPMILSGGSSMTIDVVFAPSASGFSSATLEATSSTPGISSAQATLSGAGDVGIISVTPSGNFDFGTVVTGSSVTQTFTVQNTGSVDLVLDEDDPLFDGLQLTTCTFISAGPIGPPCAHQLGNISTSLPAVLSPSGPPITFDVTFSPLTGDLSIAVVRIASTSLDVATESFTVSGTGDPTGLGAINGFVWEDTNGDGQYDFGIENPLIGWTVYLDENNNSSFDLGEPHWISQAPNSTNSFQGGYYGTGFLQVGNYSVGAVGQQGFKQTLPAIGLHAISVTEGHNSTARFGFQSLTGVRFKAWNGATAEGIRDQNATPVQDLEVRILNPTSGELISSGSTGDNGEVVLEVVPGRYVAEVVVPEGLGLTIQGAGSNPDQDNDFDQETFRTNAFDVNPLQMVDISSIMVDLAAISGRLWTDDNGNGLRNQGEGFVGSTIVKLFRAGGAAEIAMVLTDPIQGTYEFSNIQPDVEYEVSLGVPAVPISPLNVGQDDAIDSDFDMLDFNVFLTPAAGEHIRFVDAGHVPFNTFSGTLFTDSNQNGVMDASESGASGWTVFVDRDGDGLLSPGDNQEVSNADGTYQFSSMWPGTHDVAVVPQQGFVFIAPSSGSQTVMLTDGGTVPDVDFAIALSLSSIDGQVWTDTDGNGMRSDDEAPASGVEVFLESATNEQSYISQLTRSDGRYSFENLPDGQFRVRVALPEGRVLTMGADSEGNRTDSAIDTQEGKSEVLSLVQGDFIGDIDIGLTIPSSIGDFVWNDTSQDGIQNSNEAGLEGVVMQLWRRPLLIFPIQTQTTDSDGNYLFSPLSPGTYIVTIEPPSADSLVLSPANTGIFNDEIDSDFTELPSGIFSSGDIQLGANDPRTDIDAGLTTLNTIGNFIWDDLDQDGIQDVGEPGIEGVDLTISKYFPTVGYVLLWGRTETTNSVGAYSFENLSDGTYRVSISNSPLIETNTQTDAGLNDEEDSDFEEGSTSAIFTASNLVVADGVHRSDIDGGFLTAPSVGDRVWNDLNQDGIQDLDEPGIGGVTVELEMSVSLSPMSQIRSTTTDSDGNYLFSNLPVFQPPVPRFRVVIPDPPFLSLTTTDAGQNEDADSDFVASTTSTDFISPIFTAGVGTHITNIDAGMISAPSVGNYVWDDLDQDGIQDAGEPGIANVIVALHQAFGPMIVPSPLAQTTTDASGNYEFVNVPPSSTPGPGLMQQYLVRVTLPPLFEPTLLNAGSDDDLDSDFGPINSSTIVIQSNGFTLSTGQHLTGMDAGLVRPPSIGDFVWEDLNQNGIQDDGEPGIEGVTVHLHPRVAGNFWPIPVQTTTTDADGSYLFENLEPGAYHVIVEEPPGTSFIATQRGVGSDDALDSDIWLNSLMTQAFVLSQGEHLSNVDAGVLSAPSIGNRVWFDENGNGQQFFEAGIEGITVSLHTVIPFSGIVQPLPTAITTTDEDGNYLFSDLQPGEYVVRLENVTSLGYLTTIPDAGNSDAADSDFTGNTLPTSPVVLLSYGTHVTNVDAGLVLATGLSGRVWLDTNQDGVVDTNEPGIASVRVNAEAPDGSIQSAWTNSSGFFLFSQLLPNPYTISTQVPLAWNATQPSTGERSATVIQNASLPGQNFGYTIPELTASVEGLVYFDANNNGNKDPGESGLNNLPVTATVLESPESSGISPDETFSTTTDESGRYSFDLGPGRYDVIVQNSGHDPSASEQPAQGSLTLTQGGNHVFPGGSAYRVSVELTDVLNWAHSAQPISNEDAVFGFAILGSLSSVTELSDGVDVSPGDGICGDAQGNCSIRAALQEANASPGRDLIDLSALGSSQSAGKRVTTVSPNTPLPELTDSVLLFGGGELVLNGSDAGDGAIGLRLAGDFSLVSGITVTGFSSHGVEIVSGDGIQIEDNIISGNGGDGIRVSAGTGNSLRRNLLISNSGSPVDLGGDGRTLNDMDDVDSGANALQNFPVLTSALRGSLNVQGELTSSPNTGFELDFFLADVCGPQDLGELAIFAGSAEIVTDATGYALVDVNLDVTAQEGQFVAATVTSSAGNTSEVSLCIPVTEAPSGVDVDDVATEIPSVYTLHQNYPNPFNPSTTLEFEIPVAAQVQLEVFDIIGRRVAVLANAMLSAGRHSVRFDASRLSSGMYLYRLVADEFVDVKKMILVK